jgi:hypothetical protein
MMATSMRALDESDKRTVIRTLVDHLLSTQRTVTYILQEYCEVGSTTMTEPRRRNTRKRSQEDDDATNSMKEAKAQLRNKRKNRKKSFLKSLPVSSMTLQASAILVLAIITGVVWNWTHDEMGLPTEVEPVTRAFLQRICKEPDVHCHASLAPARRTQKVTRKIHTDDRVLQIPRRLLILDVDALRDPFVREQLFAKPPEPSDDTDAAKEEVIPEISAAAFLAAHLAHLQANATARAGLDPILQEYLEKVLPTYDDFASFHPVLWSDADLKELLPPHTATWRAVQVFKAGITKEYQTFTDRSTRWGDQVSKHTYQAARLAVMTRSFGTGPLRLSPDSNSNDAGQSVSLEEFEFYRDTEGIDLTQGSHAMVPILDLYNHHGKPNVGFAYNDKLSSFVISTVHGGIAAGAEVMDSYGKHTDTHLFAQYGFVNGDGSDYTEATLAVYHQPESIVTSVTQDGQRIEEEQIYDQLQEQVLNYLQHDDGYEHCVTEQDKDAWAFKLWKYPYVFQLATKKNSWTVMMTPRNPKSRPAASSNILISDEAPRFDKQRIEFAVNPDALFSMCRLLSLTHHDYNGTAQSLLEANMFNVDTLILPPTKDALEFRTLMCMARLTQTALRRFGVSVADMEDQVTRLNREPGAFQSRNWTVALLKLGEMETLEALMGVSLAGLRASFPDKMNSTASEYNMRDKPCPRANLEPLLQSFKIDQ